MSYLLSYHAYVLYTILQYTDFIWTYYTYSYFKGYSL